MAAPRTDRPGVVQAGALTWKPVPQRVRAFIGATTVLDTLGARLVWEPDAIVALYAVPEADLLVPAGPWARRHPGLDDHVVIDWPAMDRWLEEDEEVFGHPRDPYHRIDARRSSRAVRVTAGGAVLAAGERPVLLFETDLPVRCYLPRDDVRSDLLTASATVTVCAYKGRATYWSAPRLPDVAWTYAAPLPGAEAIAGLVCFLNESCDVELGGVPLGRPATKWSGGVVANERGGPSGA